MLTVPKSLYCNFHTPHINLDNDFKGGGGGILKNAIFTAAIFFAYFGLVACIIATAWFLLFCHKSHFLLQITLF